MSDQLWTLQTQTGSARSSRATISQDARITEPIDVVSIVFLNEPNTVKGVSLNLIMSLDRARAELDRLWIDGLLISGRAGQAIFHDDYCEIDLDLVYRRVTFDPDRGIYRFVIPQSPVALECIRHLRTFDRRNEGRVNRGIAPFAPNTRQFRAGENIQAGDLVSIGDDGLLYRASRKPAPAPPICSKCKHYHGQSYGDIFLVCATHPYGNGDNCPDADMSIPIGSTVVYHRRNADLRLQKVDQQGREGEWRSDRGDTFCLSDSMVHELPCFTDLKRSAS